MKRLTKEMKRSEPIELVVDDKTIRSYSGETLASALINEFGMGYAETKTGEKRGPVCNMGVCYDCSVHVAGKGNVRACMIRAEDGMEVSTEFNSAKRVATFDESLNPSFKQTLMEQKKMYDVVIIGSGPAGLAAVDELSNKELRIAVVDEQEQSGGQIYRQPPIEFNSKSEGHNFINKITHQSDVEWIHHTNVWSILPKKKDGKTDTSAEDAQVIEVCLEGRPNLFAKYIILATGAYERLLAVPGWHTPAVMSAGAIQVFLKSQGVLPGQKVFLAGNHPFLLIVAEKIINSGGEVSGIAFAQSFPQFNELIEYAFKSRKHFKKIKELLSSLRTIRKSKVPIKFGYLPTLIEGDSRQKEVTISPIEENGTQSNNNKIFESNVVGMCFGFNASSELARQIGCEVEYNFNQGGFIATHDDLMRSSISRVYVAGEITGIGGVELSKAEGRLAAYGVMNEGLKIELSTKKVNELKNQWNKWKTFADMLNKATSLSEKIYNPVSQNPETYICRCEQVTLKQIKETIQNNPGMDSLNAIKLRSRCGMGLCQGRNCEDKLKLIVNEQFPDKEITDDEFTTRFPVKPVSIKDFVR